MNREELRKMTIPVNYGGMVVGGGIVDYPKVIHVVPRAIDMSKGEVGLACTTYKKYGKPYVDLSQIWRDASEEPMEDVDIVCDDDCVDFILITWQAMLPWKEYTRMHGITKWAYVRDFLPTTYTDNKKE